LLYIYSIL